MHDYSPRLYSFFSKNIGGYNERTLHHMSMKNLTKISIIGCRLKSIHYRAQEWIEQLRTDEDATETIIVSAMVDATEPPPPNGEYSMKYHVWVGGHDNEDYDQEKFIPS